MCICKVDKVTNTMSIFVGARMSTVAKVRYMCVTSIFDFFFQISIESFTKVSFFLHTCIGISVLLLLSNCRVATSLFHHEGGVCYQGEYILYNGTSVLLLFSNCRVATSLFHHKGGVCYQGEYFLYNGTSVLLLFSII